MPISTSIVEECDLPEEAKQFLIQAGLPHETLKLRGIDVPIKDLPPLSDLLNISWEDNSLRSSYRVLGSSKRPDYLCIHQGTGTINFVRQNSCVDDFDIRHVNSDILRLAESLLVYQEFETLRPKEINNQTYEKLETMVKELEVRLKEIDPQMDEESYWPQVTARWFG